LMSPLNRLMWRVTIDERTKRRRTTDAHVLVSGSLLGDVFTLDGLRWLGVGHDEVIQPSPSVC
jgi:hypothetical protein